jgi:hypothetical protein
MDRIDVRFAINDLVARFCQSFDDKDWPALRDCLCDGLFTDYSSFRGTPPGTMSADEYVEQRRNALRVLDTQHNFHNLRVALDAAGDTATAYCHYVIHRFEPSGNAVNGRFFHSCGEYVFGCVAVNGDWKIARITQTLLRNVGYAEIHGAARSTRGGPAD